MAFRLLVIAALIAQFTLILTLASRTGQLDVNEPPKRTVIYDGRPLSA